MSLGSPATPPGGDGDGKVDCMDDDCSGSCIEKVCDDGIDDDFDGKVDCDDSNCSGNLPCP